MLKEIPHAIRPTHQKGKDPHNRIKTRLVCVGLNIFIEQFRAKYNYKYKFTKYKFRKQLHAETT